MEAIKELLYKMADDALIIGHRNSEWTGLGPVLEEDISFSSIAQDKVGHAFQLYTILHENLGEAIPDVIAFTRDEKLMKCCQFVEYPIGEYDFSLARHFFFDHAEMLRYASLVHSTYTPLAKLAAKVQGEIKYHVFHANTWLKQLAHGNEESKARMQASINETYPMALAHFEESTFEDELVGNGVFIGELALREKWQALMEQTLEPLGYTLPVVRDETQYRGGRFGYHTEYLQPLLDEMGAVFRLDPEAEW